MGGGSSAPMSKTNSTYRAPGLKMDTEAINEEHGVNGEIHSSVSSPIKNARATPPVHDKPDTVEPVKQLMPSFFFRKGNSHSNLYLTKDEEREVSKL